MTFQIDTSNGWTEARFDNNCQFSELEKIASILKSRISIVFTTQLNHLDSCYLDFIYNGTTLCLHYNVYSGISIFPTAFKESTQADNENVIAVATALLPGPGELK